MVIYLKCWIASESLMRISLDSLRELSTPTLGLGSPRFLHQTPCTLPHIRLGLELGSPSVIPVRVFQLQLQLKLLIFFYFSVTVSIRVNWYYFFSYS